jgi:hypothetical protein
MQDHSRRVAVHPTHNDTLDEIDPAAPPHDVAAWAAAARLAAQARADLSA